MRCIVFILLVVVIGALLPTGAVANPALPKVRLHLKVEPGVGPPGSPPTATILAELAWSFDPRRLGRRASIVRDTLDPWAASELPFHEPGELPWFAFEETTLDDSGELP